MLKNVQIQFLQKDAIQLRWDWEPTDSTLPRCNVFYCCTPENRLLEQGLFTEDEIQAYFDEKIIHFLGDDARQQMSVFHARNPETSRMMAFQQGSHFQENKQLSIPPGMGNHVFLVCIFDDHEIISRVVAYTGKTLEYEIEKEGFLQKIKGSSFYTVKLKCDDERKKVLVRNVGGKHLYSVLPEGYNKLYFGKELDISDIKIIYLSSLIGKNL